MSGLTRRQLLRWGVGATAVVTLGRALPGCVSDDAEGGLASLALGDAHRAYDAAGNAYFVDTFQHRVAALDASGAERWSYGGLGAGEGQLNFPVHLIFGRGGQLYVVDYGNSRVVELDAAGTRVRDVGDGTRRGRHGAVTSDGRLWLAHSTEHQIVAYEPDGRVGGAFGTFGSGAGKLNGPRALAVDGEGHLHVAEAGNARVQVFSTGGQVVRSYTSDDLAFPRAIAIDPAGFSYVADPSAGAIHVFDKAGAPVKRFEGLTLGGRRATPLDLTWRRGELYVRVA